MNAKIRVISQVALRLSASALIVVPACSTPTETVVWTEQNTSAAISPFRGAAFVIDVNTVRLSAKISAPLGGVSRNILAQQEQASMLSTRGSAQLSILGADAVDIAVSNLVRGRLGASVPGKILLTFDLSLISKLQGVRLITPTFPIPPFGVSGVQAFPFEVSVITSSGSVGAVGNELVVTTPRFGAVIASDDWDGAPHSFFNDAACTSASNDCFRYEPFGQIAPLSASVPRRVGFLIDPTVGDIRVRLLLAADIRIE